MLGAPISGRSVEGHLGTLDLIIFQKRSQLRDENRPRSAAPLKFSKEVVPCMHDRTHTLSQISEPRIN